MKTVTVIKAAVAAALLSAAGAQATTIDFDAASIAQLAHTNLASPFNILDVYHGTTYVEEGFKLQSSLNTIFGPAPNTLFAPDAVNVLFNPADSSYAMAASVGAKTTMTNVGGYAFSATSIDLAHLLDVNLPNRTVTFVGTKMDASTVTQSFTFSNDWATFYFNSGFTNLSKLSWSENLLVTRDFQVDNINVTAVPEPETYAMLMAGMALVGYAARRRKSS